MPRTDDLLNVPIWASSGSAEKNLDPRAGEPALTATDGFIEIYARPEGSKVTNQQLNQLEYWSTLLIDLYQRHGILEWHASRTYDHPALVYGSNALLYESVQTSTNQDPTTDNSETYWAPLVPTDRLDICRAPAGAEQAVGRPAHCGAVGHTDAVAADGRVCESGAVWG